MYHVECIGIHSSTNMYAYADTACLCANNMYNVANFHIRNLMTGLKKEPMERTQNERGVISMFEEAVPVLNKALLDKRDRKIRKIMSDKRLSDEQKVLKAGAVKYRQFPVPAREKWFAGKAVLEAVFKQTDNRDYRAFHTHVMQNAIRDCCSAWKGYFESLESYSAGVEGFTGRRVKRGLYRQDDGKTLNADINGSANIGRKCDARIFPEGMDYGYLYGAVRAMRYDDILAESCRYHRMAADSAKAVPA